MLFSHDMNIMWMKLPVVAGLATQIYNIFAYGCPRSIWAYDCSRVKTLVSTASYASLGSVCIGLSTVDMHIMCMKLGIATQIKTVFRAFSGEHSSKTEIAPSQVRVCREEMSQSTSASRTEFQIQIMVNTW